MQRGISHMDKIFKILKTLKKEKPSQNMGRHLALATREYNDLSMIDDKELLYAIEKYKAELDYDILGEFDEAILSEDFYPYIEDDENDI